MSIRPRPAESRQSFAASHRARTVARLIDRLCRAPGTYVVTLVIPAHGRATWKVELHRLERIRSMEIKRK